MVTDSSTLFNDIAQLIEDAHRHVATAVNLAEVYTKYRIGQYIVEYEQKGCLRAEYGKQVLQNLASQLTERFGKGWSVDTLEKCRIFYNVYSISATQMRNSKSNSIETSSKPIAKSETLLRNSDGSPSFNLSWSHYLILIRISSPAARSFYEIECKQQNWSVRQLSRQVDSSLYERLALSRDKDSVMRLATEGQIIEKPTIGILLCKTKNDALVELTLPKDANIYAAAYQRYLPDKALLQAKVNEWIAEFEQETS